MKHSILALLAVLPLALGFASCSDDDDLPDVTMSITISGGQKIGDIIYVVQSDTLFIDAINVKNNEPDKNAAITAATYIWDYYTLGTSVLPPYGFTIVTTDQTQIGRHFLEIVCPLLAVDKSVATAILPYTVQVVASPDDIPSVQIPENTFETNPQFKKG